MRDFVMGDRILIRRYTQDDVDALYGAVRESIPELAAWLPWAHDAYHRDDSVYWVASRAWAWEHAEEYSFAICDAAAGTLLGGVGLNRLDTPHGTGNLGYWVRSSAVGRGVATEAAGLAARFGFEDVGLRRIEIIAALGNIASCRVAEKLGAVREGTLRERITVRGLVHDAALYALLRAEAAT